MRFMPALATWRQYSNHGPHFPGSGFSESKFWGVLCTVLALLVRVMEQPALYRVSSDLVPLHCGTADDLR